jgi:hypothetical protein
MEKDYQLATIPEQAVTSASNAAGIDPDADADMDSSDSDDDDDDLDVPLDQLINGRRKVPA